MGNTQWNDPDSFSDFENQCKALLEERELTELRADICLSSPQSYDLEEKKQICADLKLTDSAIIETMRADFENMPPKMKVRMLDLLAESSAHSREWWERMLLNFDALPDKPPMD